MGTRKASARPVRSLVIEISKTAGERRRRVDERVPDPFFAGVIGLKLLGCHSVHVLANEDRAPTGGGDGPGGARQPLAPSHLTLPVSLFPLRPEAYRRKLL